MFFQVWFDAVVQCFYSVGVGYGTIITFSSYNPFNYNNHKDTYATIIADLAASLLAGFTVFATLGKH
jgi:SNF family Na+-dependent transporter